MPPIVHTVLLLLVAYLLGSLSGSLLLGRARGVDIREHGSGNAGGTNAFRTLGGRFALGVALVDIAKGVLATWLALRLAPVGQPLSVSGHGYAAAAMAVVGHVWPLWHGFRGGKGAATAAGGLLMLWPWVLPPLLLAWLLVLLASGYVGLATVLAACGGGGSGSGLVQPPSPPPLAPPPVTPPPATPPTPPPACPPTRHPPTRRTCTTRRRTSPWTRHSGCMVAFGAPSCTTSTPRRLAVHRRPPVHQCPTHATMKRREGRHRRVRRRVVPGWARRPTTLRRSPSGTGWVGVASRH